MKRRRVLLGAGGLFSLGFARWVANPPGGTLSIRIWMTEGAASYPTSRDRAVEYLRRALATTGHELDFSFGESPQRFGASDRDVERNAWPERVLEGVVGLSSIDPVADVNLLLTDGGITGPTAGYAFDHVAAVPGARFLAEMAPAEPSPPVFDHTVPAAITQLLIHEVGHALGLDHGHGSISTDASTVTVSPMVSGYAWAPEDVRLDQLDVPICGDEVPTTEGRHRRLSMRFSPCAEQAVRSYRGGLLP